MPDIKVIDRAGVDFVLLCCDGVWELRSSEEAVAEIHDRVYDDKFKDRKTKCSNE